MTAQDDSCPDCGAGVRRTRRPASARTACSAWAWAWISRRARSMGPRPRRPPGVLTVLDRWIGPVPRVLLRDAAEPPPGRPPGPREMPDLAGEAGRYQLLGEIARGGMGAILEGRDVDLGRDLAIKVLLEEHRDHPEMVRRFVEEAQIGGQLQHPGIVPVHELGRFPDGRLYIAMKLVQGRTLAALLEARARPGRGPAAVPLDLRAGLPDDGLCPRPGRDPPRPEAVERDGGQLRRGPGDGLGPGQGARARGRRRRVRAGTGGRDDSGADPDGPHGLRGRRVAGRLGARHARLHGPRAGPRRDRHARRAGRRLRPRLDPLRDPHRPAGLHRPRPAPSCTARPSGPTWPTPSAGSTPAAPTPS